MGRGYIRKQVFGYQKKMQRISARKEYVSMDRPEICEVARRTIDNVQSAGKQQLCEHF